MRQRKRNRPRPRTSQPGSSSNPSRERTPPGIISIALFSLRITHIEHSQNLSTGRTTVILPEPPAFSPENDPENMRQLEEGRAPRFYARLARHMQQELDEPDQLDEPA